MTKGIFSVLMAFALFSPFQFASATSSEKELRPIYTCPIGYNRQGSECIKQPEDQVPMGIITPAARADLTFTSRHPYRVVAISKFRKGEGCMAGFRRIGFNVHLKDCVLAAKRVKIPVLWYRPDVNKPATIILPLKEGDPFAVRLEEGKWTIMLENPLAPPVQ